MNPTDSCDGKQFITGGHRFAVFQTVGQHAQRERLGLGQRVRLGFPVSEAAGQFHDLGNPAAIRFALDFDFQIHSWKLNQVPDTVEFKSTGAGCAAGRGRAGRRGESGKHFKPQMKHKPTTDFLRNDTGKLMKTRGKTAWLITWEGPEAEYTGRCKVVAVLPPQFGERFVKSLLPFLYCSEHNFTLCEKMSFGVPIKKDPFFRQHYRDVNPEFLYGEPPKIYLCARKIKNLRCGESKKDHFENTLYWTEFPKFIPNPDFDPNGPLPENLADLSKQVIGEREAQYVYSIWPKIEEEKRRESEKICTGDFSIRLCA